MDRFILKAPYKPTGDQPQAIEQLVKGFKEGNQCQTLLSVTNIFENVADSKHTKSHTWRILLWIDSF